MRVRLKDDPRTEVGEDIRVGVAVGVGPMEFRLKQTDSSGHAMSANITMPVYLITSVVVLVDGV